jgi:hypothetical protein
MRQEELQLNRRCVSMRIRMMMDKSGSPDGIAVIEYKKNGIYDVPPSLGSVFISMGAAVLSDEKLETKSIAAAPENASVAAAPENASVEETTKPVFKKPRRR